MDTEYHVNPRIRAYGKARVEITRQAKDEQDWLANWREQLYAFPFEWGHGWKHCIEYKVDDFAAEIGFFIDFLGFAVCAFSPHFAQISDPDGFIYLSISEAQVGEVSTPTETIRIQFNVNEIEQTVQELEKRGIVFEQKPEPIQPDSTIVVGYFRTPHGICVDLWGELAIEVADIDNETKLGDPELERDTEIIPLADDSELEEDIIDSSDLQGESLDDYELTYEPIDALADIEENEKKSSGFGRNSFPTFLERINNSKARPYRSIQDQKEGHASYSTSKESLKYTPTKLFDDSDLE